MCNRLHQLTVGIKCLQCANCWLSNVDHQTVRIGVLSPDVIEKGKLAVEGLIEERWTCGLPIEGRERLRSEWPGGDSFSIRQEDDLFKEYDPQSPVNALNRDSDGQK